MAPQEAKAYGAVVRSIQIDCCAPCSLIWFDESESLGLTPDAVLGLFQYIGRAGAARNALASNFACPRCHGMLSFTRDLQRTTRFTYWRCPHDHGRLITFTQFLAEKNFIRPPSADELARLRATVRQLNCSQCGAPINLQTDSACPHCGAPIALIDSEGVAKALRDLVAASSRPSAGNQDDARNAFGNAQVDAIFDLQRIRDREGNHDLIAIGAAAIGAVLADWLASR